MIVATPEEAVQAVQDGDVVSVSGVVQNMVPETLCAALGKRFLDSGHPRDLGHYHVHVFGLGADAGLEHFAHPGMTKRLIVTAFTPPYWVKESKMLDLINSDAIEVYVVPAGIVAANLRETGAGRPGVLSKVGIGTFVDPRHGGGRMNEPSRNSDFSLSEVVDIAGEEYLFWPSRRVDVALIKATAADEDGNVTLEEEATYQAAVAQAMAAHACGGKVIVQVKRLVPTGSLDPRHVTIPSLLVDIVSVVPDAPLFGYDGGEDSLAYTGAVRIVPPPVTGRPFSAATIVGRRALEEIEPGQVLNLGAGIPVLELPILLDQSGLAEQVDISVEHGSLGGVNVGGKTVATHWNPTAIMSSNMTFDFYGGGGLDLAFLGMAQVDGAGNINVAKAGDMLVGIGGFMDIAQNAKKVVYCGTMRYGGLEVAAGDGRLSVVSEGRSAKVVDEVELVCFRADWAREHGQQILYVTERAVFELTDRGLTLTEVAPGLTTDDVRAQVEPEIAVADGVKEMPRHIFE